MSDLEFIKECLRMNNYYYLSVYPDSKVSDIRFTYSDRNYIIHLDNIKKVVVIEHVDSLDFGRFRGDIGHIIKYIQSILNYTKYSTYDICAISSFPTKPDKEGCNRTIEIVNSDLEGICINGVETYTEQTGEIIKREEGLNKFDERLFENNWLEDFNEKVKNISEKDLYLIISTLGSYLYKLEECKWKGELIDPFVINHALEISISEVKKYNNDFNEWYNFWKSYFNVHDEEEYLKTKIKNKDKR